MLIEFSVENFKVFKEKATLSMVAHKPYKEHPESTYTHPNFPDMPLSNAAVIYGANGSGKSSLIEALKVFGQLIVSNSDETSGWQPFLFDEVSPSCATQFDIVFIGLDDIKYNYGLSIDGQRVVSEFLLSFAKKGVRAKTLFSRVYDEDKNQYEYYHPGLTENKRTLEIVIEKTDINPKTLFLGVLNQYKVAQVKPIFKWVSEHLAVIPFERHRHFLNNVKAELISGLLDKERGKATKKAAIEFLNQFDLSINDIQVIKKDLELPDNLSPDIKNQLLTDMGYEILVFHETLLETSYPVKYELLSSGTRKLFDLSFYFFCAMATSNLRNSVLIFDEFESSFHPHIVKKIYDMLVKQVDSKVQLIITTHSPTLLDAEIIRRDQVWFVEKNAELASELYSLVDFSPTVNDNIAKGWMQGRYGAVPFIDWEQ